MFTSDGAPDSPIMRPRVLYGALFAFFSCSGGRFTAPFLESQASFGEAEIGLAMAIQSALVSLLGTPAGAFSDRLQRRKKNGRVYVMTCGLVISTIAFLMHMMGNKIESLSGSKDWAVKWYFFLRILYASGISMINPVLDGITLAHLQREGSSKSDFGKERLHGAIWWAVANIIIGICIDKWGFNVMYAATLVTCLLSILAIFGYAREQRNLFVAQDHDKREQDSLIVRDEELENYHAVSISETVERKASVRGCALDGSSEGANSLSIVELFVLIFGSVYGFGLIVSCVTLTMGTSVVESLIFLFFERLGASWTVCGLSVLVTVMFEVPIFHFAPDLLRLLGVSCLQHIACLAYITRVVGYTFIPSNHSYWILFLEPLVCYL